MLRKLIGDHLGLRQLSPHLHEFNRVALHVSGHVLQRSVVQSDGGRALLDASAQQRLSGAVLHRQCFCGIEVLLQHLHVAVHALQVDVDLVEDILHDLVQRSRGHWVWNDLSTAAVLRLVPV